MNFESHGITHAGRVRTDNQDRILVLPEVGCFAVFDGMGGQRSGDVAAEIGSIVFQNYIEASVNPAGVTWPFGFNVNLSVDSNRLLTSIRLANRQVASRADQDLKCAGMGTTVACVLIRGERLSTANVGDSRVYRLRDGTMQTLSVDDTMAGLMVSKGVIELKDVPAHPLRGILTQSVGSHSDLNVHLVEEDIRPGDVLLLCSDGLYGALDEKKVFSEVLGRSSPVADRASELIERSLAAGASDNVSVIVIGFN